MKKIKLSFLCAALLAMASAFTPQNDDPCAGIDLWYLDAVGNPHQITTGGSCFGFETACKYYNVGTEQDPELVPCDPEIHGYGRFLPNAIK